MNQDDYLCCKSGSMVSGGLSPLITELQYAIIYASKFSGLALRTALRISY